MLQELVVHESNAYSEGKAGSTPLERLREKRGGQAPRSYPFGAVGFLKPIHPSNGLVSVWCCAIFLA